MKIIETEILIVGSGPGGATVARDLTRAGRAVVLLEKGKRHPITTSRINSFRMYDKYAVFSKSKEGVIVDRAITVGGCSVVFSGTSFDPPEWLQEEIGMDLRPAASRIKKEIGINRFSEKFTKPGIGVQRLREAASDLGLDLAPQEKFIREDLCRNVCDGCMTGCRNGAKWTAREWIDDAVGQGATLLSEANVTKIGIENGRATGVEAKTKDGPIRVRAAAVVVSAGGIGTGVLLQRSGIDAAGGNFYMDPMNVLWGMMDKPYNDRSEMTFNYATAGTADSKGYIIGNASGKGAWTAQLFRPKTAFRVLGSYGKWGRMIGLFTKVADSAEGRVEADGTMRKPFNREDLRRANEATLLARDIMVGAGVNPDTIQVVENIGGHPGGTAAVGRVVDRDLAVKGVEGLYVCDASVFPRSPGRPPTLMILALAAEFSRKMIAA